MTALTLRRVSRALGAAALLQEIELEIASGEPLAVLGPSGAGKSTLLRLLAGLDAPTEGEVWGDGRLLSRADQVIVPPHERRLSLVFQDLALWPSRSALDNVLLGLARSPLSRRERRARAVAMLALCGIEPLAARLPAALSGGEQQRVALARALAPAPDWLLLDEPFSNLDPILRDRLVADVRGLASEQHATIVLVTHELADALALTRRAVILERGRVVEAGPWEPLLAAPSSDLLRGLAARAERVHTPATVAMVVSAGMTDRDTRSGYVLGYTEAEHERLIRQAERLAGCSERFFRAAGIGEAQRVLELGSGVGDVAMLAARLVGPTGSVVGVERDARSIERARARVAAAGFSNVTFTQSDVAEVASDQLFDAVVGRFILMFVPNPVAVLRSALRKLRPGGVVAFHEPSWVLTLQLSAHLPLRSACLSLTHDTIRRSGANTEMGLDLHRAFPEAGLPAPSLLVEVPVGTDRALTCWTHDLFCTLLPQLEPGEPALAALGDLASLAERLDAEAAASNGVVPHLGMVGAWSRKP